MSRVCPNCSYQRTSADTSPQGQCPKCGIYYEKFFTAQSRAREQEKSAARRAALHESLDRSRRNTDWSWLGNALIAGAILGLLMAAPKLMKLQRTADRLGAAPASTVSSQPDKP